MQKITFSIILIIVFISIIAVYFVTAALTLPIRKLRDDILKVDYENLSLRATEYSFNNEINLLNHAFYTMIERIKKSVENELRAKDEEMKARFEALQAQIAPHFIHNVLYLISISAQENKYKDVVDMCKKLSVMLRYVTAHSQLVKLEDEIEYTENYLYLLKKKYEDFLNFEIEIKGKAQNLQLPRLVIQPFVENSIKHAFNYFEPPWMISVKCIVDEEENNWKITIADNGCGFAPDILDKINSQINDIDSYFKRSYDNETNSNNGGLGIINTFLRLKMFYGDNLVFNIQSNKNGTIINIEGSIKK